MKSASCHTDKPYFMKNMCKTCYNKQRYVKSMQNPENVAKARLNTRRWAKANPQRVLYLDRSKNLKKKYGISYETYQELLKSQAYKCALCNQPETVIIRKNTALLAVDHDHKTGKIRGLLCFRCNTGLALIENNPEVLARMLNYLGRGGI